MHCIIAGATGLIGKRLTAHWLKQNHRVTAVGRSLLPIQQIFGAKVQALTWDQLTEAVLQSADVIVNLAGANIAAQRWSAKRKQEIINSRVESTKKIVDLLINSVKQSQKIPLLLNASGLGVYGLQKQLSDRLPVKLDENTIPSWENPPDFLSLVGQRWEEATKAAGANNVRVVLLRFGVVLAKEGGALPKLMQPFRYFLGGPIGSGCQPFSWIAIDDVIRAIDFLVAKQDASGPYNVVAPDCVFQKAFAEALAKTMNRPDAVKMPSFLVRVLLGQMGKELLLEGQRVYPQRLFDAGFTFSYPTLQPALAHLCHEK